MGLKEQCQEDFAVLGQFCDKIILWVKFLFTHAKTFHRVFTVNLWQDILYHAVFMFTETPLPPLTKLLVRCINAPWKSFYVNLIPFERLALNRLWHAFWKLIRSHAVTPRWLDDAKECIQSRGQAAWLMLLCTRNSGRFKSCISRKFFGG